MILEWGRYPGEGNNPPQYSCLGNPMDRGAWWAAVHGVPKSWTLSDSTAAERSSEERLVRVGRAEPLQEGCVARRVECGAERRNGSWFFSLEL